MMKLKAMLAMAVAVLLQGCFLSPGTFGSSLDLRRDGSFAFVYKGEIVFAVPDDLTGQPTETWRDDMATCEANDSADGNSMDAGKCTPEQIAEQRKTWEGEQTAKVAKNADEARKFATLFGYTPGDDEANRKLAAQIAKVDGFRSVTYAGKGVFTVDYAKSGRLDHDFVFPTLLQGNVMFPFVLARRQNDGAVRVAAPAYVGKGGLGMFDQLSKLGGESASTPTMPPARTKGRFTLTTDGEVLTNNTEDGPVAAGGVKRLVWDVDQRSAVPPEALIKLR